MEKSIEKGGSLLPIGDICNLYGITWRTLHIYGEKGLLEPAYVNPDTGYRYYTADQCSKLDLISELQVIGFTLSEISHLQKLQDVHEIRAALKSKSEALSEEAKRIEIAKSVTNCLLERCDIMLDPPICDQIQLEFVPERKVLVFDVHEDAGLEGDNELQIQRSLQGFRIFLKEQGFSKSIYPRMITAIPKENLENDSFEVTHYYAPVDDISPNVFRNVETLPAAQCLTMFSGHSESSPERLLATDVQLISRMLEYAEHKGFAVAGDVQREIIIDTSLFGYDGTDFFFKLIMPVKRA